MAKRNKDVKGGRGKRKPKPTQETQAEALVRLAAGDAGARTVFWYSPAGEVYATFGVKHHRETWPLRSARFREWLADRYHKLEGRVASDGTMQAALVTLRGTARTYGKEHPDPVRLAEHEGTVYLDLGDPCWRAVALDAGGWEVVDNPPVYFRRPSGLGALPEPRRGGSLDRLRALLNIATGADWLLVVGWVTFCIRPGGPYPLLQLSGERGSAKSTAARLLRSAVDPSTVPLRSPPREEKDLVVAARGGWVVALDNLSVVPDWLSNALCRLATGGGLAGRKLYTDDEVHLIDAIRPVLLTSIEDVVTAGDLLDRAVRVGLEPIPDERRLTEEDLRAAWREAHPWVLGAILDAACAALKELPAVRAAGLPRMADFGKWLVALERGLGWEPGSALAAYRKAIADAVQLDLDASAVAAPLLTFIADRAEWEGTAAELLEHLGTLAGEKVTKAKGTGWPAKPHSLSGQLRKLAPSLRRVGVWVTFDRTGKNRDRIIRVEKGCKTASAASAASADDGNPENTEVPGGPGGRSADAGGRSADVPWEVRASAKKHEKNGVCPASPPWRTLRTLRRMTFPKATTWTARGGRRSRRRLTEGAAEEMTAVARSNP